MRLTRRLALGGAAGALVPVRRLAAAVRRPRFFTAAELALLDELARGGRR